MDKRRTGTGKGRRGQERNEECEGLMKDELKMF